MAAVSLYCLTGGSMSVNRLVFYEIDHDILSMISNDVRDLAIVNDIDGSIILNIYKPIIDMSGTEGDIVTEIITWIKFFYTLSQGVIVSLYDQRLPNLSFSFSYNMRNNFITIAGAFEWGDEVNLYEKSNGLYGVYCCITRSDTINFNFWRSTHEVWSNVENEVRYYATAPIEDIRKLDFRYYSDK